MQQLIGKHERLLILKDVVAVPNDADRVNSAIKRVRSLHLVPDKRRTATKIDRLKSHGPIGQVRRLHGLKRASAIGHAVTGGEPLRLTVRQGKRGFVAANFGINGHGVPLAWFDLQDTQYPSHSAMSTPRPS